MAYAYKLKTIYKQVISFFHKFSQTVSQVHMSLDNPPYIYINVYITLKSNSTKFNKHNKKNVIYCTLNLNLKRLKTTKT
jgi:hypothetical protein